MSHITTVIKHWRYIAPVIKQPVNKKQLEKLVSFLDALLEIVEDNENHELMGLIDLISSRITRYEEEHLPKPKAKGIDALKFLMITHNLKQSDLSEIASQGVMSEILNGKRALNLRQIQLLAKRFKLDIATFLDE